MKPLLYSQTLPPKTARLIKEFKRVKPRFLKNFYLSGGTALSLQIGHRESNDLDFFCQKDFDPILIQTELKTFGQLKNLQLDKNTLNAFLGGVKIQFLTYPYPLLKPIYNWEGLGLSSVIDIACTKLQTISSRGSKKDFIDLYFLLQKYSLPEIFQQLDKKYRKIDFNKVHILKSLVYFVDADKQPMPRMHQDASWKEIKNFVTKKVKMG
ncbi:MAG: nucleotidyl transferase AbiEii/AbiGii toxin family protein [Patescibacteria group bacterium]